MQDTLKRAVFLGAIAVSLSGCATRDFVREQVAQLEARRDAVDKEQNARTGQISNSAQEALDRANAAHKLAEGKFLYSIVLSDASITFDSGKAELNADAQARLVQFAQQLKSENRNVYLEIQGHTDANGSREQNQIIGAKRAEAVRLFLNQQGVALHRVSTISYGEDTPVAPNNTRDGRAANRRVVVIVMS